MIARTRGLSSLIWATPIYRTRRATRRRTASLAVHDRNLCKPTGMICAPRPANADPGDVRSALRRQRMHCASSWRPRSMLWSSCGRMEWSPVGTIAL